MAVEQTEQTLTPSLFLLLRLLVLDEMDQLDSKAQDVLYTIFEWPYLPKSRLCLIGKSSVCQMLSPLTHLLHLSTWASVRQLVQGDKINPFKLVCSN